MEDKTILKAFPTEISEYIELPDIAELLTYPIFYDTDADDAYRYGSDFQRKLIDMTPLKHNKKTYSVLSEVRLLLPYYRAVTNNTGNKNSEWHIDCEEENKYVFHEERDIVHLLTNETSAMTQFNEKEVILDINPFSDSKEFYGYLRENVHLLNPKTMPSNKIVTFSNHLHRATQPQRIEFRYMFRFVETNRKRPAVSYNRQHITTITGVGDNKQLNIAQEKQNIKIYLPQEIYNSGKYLPKDFLSTKTIKKSKELLNLEQVEQNDVSLSFKTLEVTDLSWGSTKFHQDCGLKEFLSPQSLVIICQRNFSDEERPEYRKFLDLISHDVNLIDSKGEVINGKIGKTFYSFDANLGNVAGVAVDFTDNERNSLVKQETYTLHFTLQNGYGFVISPNLTFKY